MACTDGGKKRGLPEDISGIDIGTYREQDPDRVGVIVQGRPAESSPTALVGSIDIRTRQNHYFGNSFVATLGRHSHQPVLDCHPSDGNRHCQCH